MLAGAGEVAGAPAYGFGVGETDDCTGAPAYGFGETDVTGAPAYGFGVGETDDVGAPVGGGGLGGGSFFLGGLEGDVGAAAVAAVAGVRVDDGAV